MTKTIITTVGTSIFENYNKSKNGKDSNFNANYPKLRDGSYPFSEWTNHASRICNLKCIIKKTFNNSNNNTSAEIDSILSIANQAKEGEEVKVHLIATDTVLSVLAAELIGDWFNEEKVKKEYSKINEITFERPKELKKQEDSEHIINKLRVSSNKDYQEGFMNLIEVVSKLIDKGKKAKEEVILNITGGYKAIIPIMTLIGQIKEVPLKYIYEESSFEEKDGLVEVGNLPVSFDWGVIDALKPFLNVTYSSFWDEDNKRITKAIHDGRIYLDIPSNSFRETTGKNEFKDFLNKKDLRIIKSLLDLKLITGDAKVTALGGLLKKVQELESRRGYQMEYILYNYFARPEDKKNKGVNHYSSTTIIDLTGSFKFNESNKLITRADRPSGDWRELGDIDLSLKNGETPVLGESKSFSKFLSYKSSKHAKKYTQQIHARLQRFVELNEDKVESIIVSNNDKNKSKTTPLEFLMIIFQFQFKGFEENILDNEIVKKIIANFKELEKEEIATKNLKFKPTINFLGLRCLIDLNHKNISANYTSFYQEPTFEWEVMNGA